MIRLLLLSILSCIILSPLKDDYRDPDYKDYHLQVIEAEQYIASDQYAEALKVYETLIDSYKFVFKRDYQIAAQLAIYLEETEKTAQLLRKGITAGWTKKSIRKNKYLAGFRKTEAWKEIRKDYKKFRNQYEASLDAELRNRVKELFSRDQKKAFAALFTFGSKAQDRYAEKKFAPHSERQMAQVSSIMEEYGYPGEKLIGNDFWMSTIVSHHNSISQKYVVKDTLYPEMQDDLQQALKKGQISPFEYALMDEWYRTIKSGWQAHDGYGILNPPYEKSLPAFNLLREKCFLRPIELRNKLVEIEEKTGMDFYLPGGPWIDGKIEIKRETP